MGYILSWCPRICHITTQAAGAAATTATAAGCGRRTGNLRYKQATQTVADAVAGLPVTPAGKVAGVLGDPVAAVAAAIIAVEDARHLHYRLGV